MLLFPEVKLKFQQTSKKQKTAMENQREYIVKKQKDENVLSFNIEN